MGEEGGMAGVGANGNAWRFGGLAAKFTRVAHKAVPNAK